MKTKLEAAFWYAFGGAVVVALTWGTLDFLDQSSRASAERSRQARIAASEAAWQEPTERKPEPNRLWVVETVRGTALSVAPNEFEAKTEADRATREQRPGQPRPLDLGLKERGAVILGGRP